jgi:response regulator RpfG family c-di-GMP phosphodiesterase
LGAEDYLVKPVNRQELVTTIRSRLNRSQQLMLAQLKQAYRDSLKMLSTAIELRDHYTHAHVERVMDYASTIARDMGLNDSQMEALQFGSILHDIGKIYIPESVLQKPGSLDDEEWDVMKMHPVIGADLIKDISYLAPAIPVIRHHHERWDGKGYPDGLVGEAIPLEARIVAVADSLDAMTTERVYQSTCTSQEAYDKILSCSGTLYDPGVIDVFQGVWQGIKLRME